MAAASVTSSAPSRTPNLHRPRPLHPSHRHSSLSTLAAASSSLSALAAASSSAHRYRDLGQPPPLAEVCPDRYHRPPVSTCEYPLPTDFTDVDTLHKLLKTHDPSRSLSTISPPPRRRSSDRKPLVTPITELKRRARLQRKSRQEIRELPLHPPDNGLLVKSLVSVAHQVLAARAELLDCALKVSVVVSVHVCRSYTPDRRYMSSYSPRRGRSPSPAYRREVSPYANGYRRSRS